MRPTPTLNPSPQGGGKPAGKIVRPLSLPPVGRAGVGVSHRAPRSRPTPTLNPSPQGGGKPAGKIVLHPSLPLVGRAGVGVSHRALSSRPTPLPASPARGEVRTVFVGRLVQKQLDRNTSPLAGEAGRGVANG